LCVATHILKNFVFADYFTLFTPLLSCGKRRNSIIMTSLPDFIPFSVTEDVMERHRSRKWLHDEYIQNL